MTNKKIGTIVLGIMCFLLTAGICIQIKTVKNTNTKISQNYETNNLRAEVLKYKEKYDNLIKDTDKINEELQQKIEKATENNSELEDAKNQITEGNKIIGLTEVKGPGVIITVTDSDLDSSKFIDSSMLLVHDKDVLKIINELRNAGAEAISINDQRVIQTTSITCAGNIINVNGEKTGAPFIIKAIGPQDNFKNLSRPGGYLKILEEFNINVKYKEVNELTIPKYSGVLNFKNVKIVE